MRQTTPCDRILQIHPTRRCNLRCLHCYSSSSPDERDEINIALLLQTIEAASLEGYTTVSFSGGEPILYQPLQELLEQAHRYKMKTAVVSNGMLLNQQNLDKLAGAIDLLAISIDGVPEYHNLMRNSEKAFETMAARLEAIRQSGISFGFLFTLTQSNFRQLDWVANFAIDRGAKLLQIHLLEEVGRAKENLSAIKPNPSIAAYAYLKAMRLREILGDRLYIQIDLAHQEILRSNPLMIVPENARQNAIECNFAEIISPLIVEADGTVVPMQHGLAREYALGNLNHAPLRQLMEKWFTEVYPAFTQLCRSVYEEAIAPSQFSIANWYEILSRQASYKNLPK